MARGPFDIALAAVEEAEDARDWYLLRSPSAAQAFLVELERAFQKIVERPGTWPSFDGEFSYFVLNRFPFKVVYRQRGERVEVLAVAHDKRKPGYWRSRS